MQKRTSFLSVLMILLVVVLALLSPSCVTTGPEPTEAPVTRPPVTEVVPTPEPVQVHLVGRAYEDYAVDLEVYLLDQCGVTYDFYGADYWDKLQIMFEAGEEFDILHMDTPNLPFYAQQGYLAPVDDSAGIDFDQFIEPLVRAFAFEGMPYGIPRDFETLALFYNQDLFDESGLDEPNDDWGWYELLDAAWYIVDSTGVPGFSVPAVDWVFAPFVLQNGGRIMNEDFSDTLIDSPEAMEAGEFYAYAYWDGWATIPEAVDADSQDEAFGRGDVAMMLHGSWVGPWLSEAFPDLNYGVVHPPAGPGGEGNLVFADGYAVSANSSAPQAAWKAIACLTSEKAQALRLDSGLTLPTRWSLEGHPYLQDNPVELTFFTGVAFASPYTWGPHHREIGWRIEDALLRVYYDGWSVDESFWQAAEEIRSMTGE